jgi:uncharacterized damage-inducible protein DinB
VNAHYFRFLYDYNYWARDRILAAAEGMTDEEYQKPNGFTYNGLHSILAHCLASENVWSVRLLGEEFTGLIPEEEINTLATLTACWKVEEGRWRDFLSALSDDDLTREIIGRRGDGTESRTPVWVILAQVANHGTQHRSEAAEALTMIGRSPGSLDLTTMYRERKAPQANNN